MRMSRLWPIVLLAVALLPEPAAADHLRGHVHGHARDFGRRPGAFRRGPVFVTPPTVFLSPDYAPPPVVYAPPPVIYYAPPAYAYARPPAYAAPPTPAPPPPPAAPPEPRVVEFDNGRYEMRGDGIREPYVWVWVPKAPTAPPPGAAPAPPARPTTLYRFTDERGVVTWTDDLNKVPPQLRAAATRPQP
jgi:hypothetical protein